MAEGCWHCKGELKKSESRSLTAKLRPPSNKNVLSALNTIYGCGITIDEESLILKQLKMCNSCHCKVSTVEKFYTEFLGNGEWKNDLKKKLVSEDDAIQTAQNSIPQATTSTAISKKRKASTSPPKKIKRLSRCSPRPSTPLRKKLTRSERTIKERSTVWRFVCSRLRRQMVTFAKTTCLKSQVEASDDMRLWPNLTSELCVKAPFVLRVLEAVAGEQWRPTYDNGIITPAVGAALCILLNQRNKFCTRFQKMTSLILSATMASKETYKMLNSLNICTSYSTTQRLLTELSKGHNAKMLEWKENFCNSLSKFSANRSAGLPVVDEFVKSAFVVFDNINVTFRPYHTASSPQRGNNMLTGVVFAGVINRIPQPVSNFLDQSTLKAVDVPFSAYFLTEEESKELEKEQKMLIRGKLIKYLTLFNRLDKAEQHQIVHQFSQQSSEESVHECHGVLHEDENNRHGSIRIASHATQYQPKVMVEGVENKIEFIMRGDGLSIKRLTYSIDDMAVQETIEEKIINILPVHAKWHLQCEVLHKNYLQFFKSATLTSGQGSMPFIRGRFGFVNVKSKVAVCVNPARSLLKFTSNSYILAEACRLIGLAGPSDTAQINRKSDQDLERMLEDVTNSIFKMQWIDYRRGFIQKSYCMCKRSFEETQQILATEPLFNDWLMCENPRCEIQWYHKYCVNLKKLGFQVDRAVEHQPPPEDDNSEESTETEDIDFNPIPILDEEIDGPCELKKKEEKAWYCSTKCKLETDDKIFQYTIGLINSELIMEGFKHAVRSNDGKRMLAHHKLALCHISNARHPTYFHLLVSFLANVGGHATKHAVFDMMNNGTVNIQGRTLGNIECDLYNEFEICIIKKVLRNLRGKITDNMISRISQYIGVANELKERAAREICQTEILHKNTEERDQYMVNLRDSIQIVLVKKLTQNTKQIRSHQGFENFNYGNHILCDRVDLSNRILEECKKMDTTKEMNAYHSSTV